MDTLWSRELFEFLPLLRYLQSLARPDGGYAWQDQEESHLTPTYAVIGCYQALDHQVPDTAKLAEFVRTHHPSKLKKLEQDRRVFLYQQVQALKWLGDDAADFREAVLALKQPVAYLKQYEKHGYPIFQSELGAIFCRSLLNLPLADAAPFTAYLQSRRRENGSFNNTPAADGGDGHVMNTLWGLKALDALGRIQEKRESTIAWIQRCQLASGGFGPMPEPAFGGWEDAGYTWAAVRGLKLLGASASNGKGCIEWLCSLANADGGFSDRPGWLSNPMATWYVLDALKILGALPSLSKLVPRPAPVRSALPKSLKAFSIQIEAHGQGSPAEAVDLAGALRIHLWGAKNAKPEWIDRAQMIAHMKNVPVMFFVANEEYGTWVDVPGLGTYSHTSDIIAPVGGKFGPPVADQGIVSWAGFRKKRLAPLQKAGGTLVWQFGENEELVRLYLDDSVARSGYSAISTFHFGNPDFTNSEPFLHRWRGRIPYIALQDSHGAEPWWWADMTTGFRTVFLAQEPTWSGWMKALKENWVVAVRHDVWSGNKTWMHSGSREVLEAVREQESSWRWWDNPAIQRPWVSLVPVKPANPFEVECPDKGVTLRVRCAWETNPQGLLKQPLCELVQLIVDDKKVTPTLVSTKAPKGNLLSDHYHHYPVTTPGNHKAEAVVKILATQTEASRTIEFSS